MAEATQNGRYNDAIRQADADPGGRQVPDELKEDFEDLLADSTTLQAKYVNFSAAIHQEQKMLAIRAKEIWEETMAVMGLQGKWRYENGMVWPVDEPETK